MKLVVMHMLVFVQDGPISVHSQIYSFFFTFSFFFYLQCLPDVFSGLLPETVSCNQTLEVWNIQKMPDNNTVI